MPDDPKPLAVVPDPPAVSPTGAPMLPAKLAPYFFAAATVCGIVAGASKIPGLNLPESVFGWATLGATLFAALAGMTPGWRKAAPGVLLMLAVGLSSCAHAQSAAPLQIAGMTLDAAGDLFEATEAGMTSANDSLTAEQRSAWNAFLPRWRAGYHVSVEAWRAAKAKADQSGMQQAAAAIGALVGELGVFAAMLVPGGA